ICNLEFEISKKGRPMRRPFQFRSDRCLERGIEEWPQLLRSRRMPQLAQRLRFDLADALACDIERAANLFECVLGAVADAEAHLENLLLARCERAKNFVRLLFE